MRAAVFYGGHDIRVEERELPEPGPGEVLVRVRAAGICGSDLHHYRSESPWARRGPEESGHELAGEVAALGPEVEALRVGQRVGVEPEHLIGCGRCERCLAGDTHLCASRGRRGGAVHHSHGFSEFDACVAENVHPLPDAVTLDAASILDCYACGVHAVHLVPPTPASTVVVIGTGAIGMTLAQVARSAGAGRIVIVGTRQDPVELAVEAGIADAGVAAERGDPVEAVREATGGGGADIVFETVGGKGRTLTEAIEMSRRGGIVCVLGIFTGSPELPAQAAFSRELVLRWSNSYSRWNGVSEYQIALDLLAAGRLRAEPLITHHFPLEQVVDAFAAAADKRSSSAIKVLVHP
ncbi:MAG TPA: alcohol dehydrogenase catalytic domain-containing protein [Candidatus Dormibacteraeota bacterium]|jgi:2-desacetyl-2-hydroxyethyl bacteriochlorophyllide A dehydrogenase|nr:alcohol dehydrogenase catalytic domain-containing protein [Candidatus Dormibacteraeota bacterium]